jgi:tRNA G46 methylase TrmB
MGTDKEEDGKVAPVATTIVADAITPPETGTRQEEPCAKKETENRLAPFNPTCDEAQQTAIRLLGLGEDDVLFDLGCGDGRLLITAVEQIKGLRCVGIEMDTVFTSRAVTSISQLSAETKKRIEIREGDVLELGYKDDSSVQQQQQSTATAEKNTCEAGELCQNLTLLNDATAVYLFLVPNGLKKLKPLLDRVVDIRKKQKRAFSVAAYMFQVRGWEPTLVDRTTKGEAPLYIYRFEASS